jgi:hypothetical protein
VPLVACRLMLQRTGLVQTPNIARLVAETMGGAYA